MHNDIQTLFSNLLTMDTPTLVSIPLEVNIVNDIIYNIVNDIHRSCPPELVVLHL